jgi:hypothetical protein
MDHTMKVGLRQGVAWVIGGTGIETPRGHSGSTTVVVAAQGTATATPRQATATTAAHALAAATRKGDLQSIFVGKPVSIVATPSRTVVAVEVKNTGDRYATFTLRPKPRTSAKPVLATQTTVMAMPAGATWTVTMIADEIQARDQDLFDLYVDSYFVVPQTVDPTVRLKIKLTEPVVTVDGKQTKVAVEAKNENE